jgi:OOP family OmpA-OmpF porin
MKQANNRDSAGRRLRRIALVLATVSAATAAAFAGVTPASAQVMVLTPPAPMREVAPPPRSGWAWVPGFWGWQQGRYVWVPGHWIPVAQAAPVTPPPPPPPPVAEVFRLSADALFAFDRYSLADMQPGGRSEIRDIAARLNRLDFDHIEVRGYTDRLGTVEHNMQLSQRRADSVKSLLVQQGIPAARIDARGYGPQDPITDNCSDSLPRAQLIECLQPDRRVEIVTYARRPRRWVPPSPGGGGMAPQ